MRRSRPTLAEISMRQQVRAANRDALRNWLEGGVSAATYWVIGLGAGALVLGALAWHFMG